MVQAWPGALCGDSLVVTVVTAVTAVTLVAVVAVDAGRGLGRMREWVSA
ncbi:hypothetical protein ABZ027_11675 [Streptomyces sp. NPDC006332]